MYWKRIAVVALAAVVLAGFAFGESAWAGDGGQIGPMHSSYVLPGDAVFPEGVAYQPSTLSFYVSSTSDGTIFRSHITDSTAQVFLPGGADGRTTAIGLAVDSRDRLFVSGGATGQLFVYDTGTGRLLGKLSNGLSANTFVNDVVVAPTGEAYATDSRSPFLYKVFVDQLGNYQIEAWVGFEGTPAAFQEGFNLNGIDVSADGSYLIVVQSNTGKLFRISTTTKEVVEIDLAGETVSNGDGILLMGRALYVSRNQQGEIVKIQLSPDLSSGTVLSRTTDPSLTYPTTLAAGMGRLLVVNSQFNNRGEGRAPVLPFTVSAIPTP